MRPKKIDNGQLIKGLTSVLRNKGYDGASMNELAKASGLQKASLYHRFPGGKEEMARSVLENIHDWIEANVLKVVADSSRNIEDRLTEAIANIRDFYQNGEAVCIIRALSIGSGLVLFGEELRASIKSWEQAFVKLGLDAGMDKEKAEVTATEVFILIQGSLVLSNGVGSPLPFNKALADIKEKYME